MEYHKALKALEKVVKEERLEEQVDERKVDKLFIQLMREVGKAESDQDKYLAQLEDWTIALIKGLSRSVDLSSSEQWLLDNRMWLAQVRGLREEIKKFFTRYNSYKNAASEIISRDIPSIGAEKYIQVLANTSDTKRGGIADVQEAISDTKNTMRPWFNQLEKRTMGKNSRKDLVKLTRKYDVINVLDYMSSIVEKSFKESDRIVAEILAEMQKDPGWDPSL